MTRRAVFLDRDGVINRSIVREGKPYPPQTMDELEILPGVPEALEQLRAAGYLLIVVTNQPDVARGTQSQDAVEAMHEALKARLALDKIVACYHDNKEACRCRKPAPGMLFDAAAEYDIDLPTSYMVGDRWRDIEAGERAGCTTIFIDYHYDEALTSQPDHVVESLSQVAAWILEHRSV